jgi:hypothetical protein
VCGLTNPVDAENSKPYSILPIAVNQAGLMKGGHRQIQNGLKHSLRRTILPLAIRSRELMSNALDDAKISNTTLSEDLSIITSNPNDNINQRKLITEAGNETHKNIEELRLRLGVKIPNKASEIAFEDKEVTTTISRSMREGATKIDVKASTRASGLQARALMMGDILLLADDTSGTERWFKIRRKSNAKGSCNSFK